MAIKAGLILTQEFEIADLDKEFSGIIDYYARKEATMSKFKTEDIVTEAKEIIHLYGGIIDYMGDNKKTVSVFTKENDAITFGERKDLKNFFDKAQENGCNQNKSVVSFDNKWLDKTGLRDKTTGYIDDVKLKHVMRLAMRTIIEEENFHKDTKWVGAIHYNRPHIHIHASIVEPKSTRKTIEDGKYKGQFRGMISQTTINKAKSKMVNNILSLSRENELINNLTRDVIVENLKKNSLVNDKELSILFLCLHSILPKENKRWFYNGKQIQKHISMVDELSKKYIEKYCIDEYLELKNIAFSQSEKYKEAYGESYRGYKIQQEFLDNKEKDLLYRMGNTILKKLREYDKQIILNDEGAELPPTGFDEGAELPPTGFDEGAELPPTGFDEGAELPPTGFDEGAELPLTDFELIKEAGKVIDSENDEDVILGLKEINRLRTGKTYEYATYILGKFYMMNLKYKNSSKSESLFKEIEKGFLKKHVTYSLSKLYLEDDEMQDTVKGIEYLTKSVELNNQYAQHKLGKLYINGEYGLQPDTEKGELLIRKSANQGNVFARYFFNELEMNDNVDLTKESEIVRFIYLSATVKNKNYKYFPEVEKALLGFKNKELISSATYSLGKFYLEDKQLQDTVKGIEYLAKSAELNNDYAQHKLGKMYVAGEYGLQKDTKKGELLIRKSANQGNVFAKYFFNELEMNEDVDLTKENEIVKFVYLSATVKNKNYKYLPEVEKALQGFKNKDLVSSATYSLGKFYLEDEQVQDAMKGVEYLTKSAELNNDYAQYKLGTAFYYGKFGVKQDLTKGMTYLKQSKENGNKYANNQLKYIRKHKYSRDNNRRYLNNALNGLKKTLKKNMQDYVNEQQHQQLLKEEEKEKRREFTY